jgi:hypothetical protein
MALGGVSDCSPTGYRVIDQANGHFSRRITVDAGLTVGMSFWQGMPNDGFTRPIWPPVRKAAVTFHADASAFAWGAVMQTPEMGRQSAHEFFPGRMGRKLDMERAGGIAEGVGGF